jgi:peptidoglycan/LPS O-acetylase OafA/YrhL
MLPNCLPEVSFPPRQSAANPRGVFAPVTGYRPELDALRLLAFLLVFFHHSVLEILTFNTNGHFHDSVGEDVWKILIGIFSACGMGLCLFFCLSAYLITELLLREGKRFKTISVRDFYIRRTLRIWPLYVFGLLLGICWGLTDHASSQWPRLTWYLLFAGNIYCARFGWSGNPMTPLWSISIEEQFYLIWPWVMHFVSRRGIFLCALFFIVLANITLYILGQRHASADTTVWANTFVQFQMFAVGILLALAPTRTVRGGAAAGILLVAIGPVLWFVACYVFHAKKSAGGLSESGSSLVIGYALMAIGCAAILQGFCNLGPAYMPRWAVSLGKISYGLYVYHLSALRLSRTILQFLHFRRPLELSVPCGLMLTILIAKLSYSGLESPFLRLKRRFEIIHTRPI